MHIPTITRALKKSKKKLEIPYTTVLDGCATFLCDSRCRKEAPASRDDVV
ncbi:MAG TPA: hypothetical protein VEJ22_05955 [Nitrospirota bacterium]|nr:hypothetical protein [Nitrospirota bacterium]